jgi:hypothetical protein
MVQSLKAKFNGNKGEVIEYTRVWGRHKAMDKFGVRDYIAFSRFLEEETKDASFGLRPLLNDSANSFSMSNFLDTVTTTISSLKAERDRLRGELHQARIEIEYLKAQEALQIEPKLQAVIAECQT